MITINDLENSAFGVFGVTDDFPVESWLLERQKYGLSDFLLEFHQQNEVMMRLASPLFML